ncbi:helicase associated domain-containing protein (plasmid) [Streptomyces sp. HUAS TT11]|uniref:helicase associated domain-containing protein n=1 Tax=Streptomyces sp. HUAS TT11 TaxID=3447508 RepID=UPI003F658260
MPPGTLHPIGEKLRLPLPARERAFQRGLAAARAFREREGHLRVPQRHIEEIDGERVRLGQWLSNLNRRRSGLSPQRQALTELGL